GVAEAMLLLKYPIAKSFEVYAGPGAEFQCFDFESLSNFSQAWGVVAQLGCRGRTSDHFGVGVDATVHYLITKGLDFGPLLIDLRAYISAEI
ncbi:MAG: hypothetical protein MJ052_05265, partial [Sphaerochaetaceae bacterium]|nr:hypothetical protein [Sphaerochaetaceae bacterium]